MLPMTGKRMTRSKSQPMSSCTADIPRPPNAERSVVALSGNPEVPALDRGSRRLPGFDGIDKPGDPHRTPPHPRHPPDNVTSLKGPDAALEWRTSGPRLDLKRVIRRRELRQLVPLSDTTIYEMEQRGEFPRRFYLTPRCAAWDLGAVEGWIEERRRASEAQRIQLTPPPDVRRRKNRPVRR